MDVKLEYWGEDREIKGAKIWKVEAIHVTTTRNRRKFTLEELRESARSLSFRGLNRNHEEDRQLPWPENTTRGMKFNPRNMSVEGTIRVAESDVNALIEAGKIKKLSIEQIPTDGESCNEVYCEQHGVAFIGLALLDEGIVPGDEMAEIKGFVHTERAQKALKNYMTLSECLVSDAQRECKECTDFEACHTCKHKLEAGNECLEKAIIEITTKNPTWNKEAVLAEAVTKCEFNETPNIAMAWYRHAESKFEKLLPSN